MHDIFIETVRTGPTDPVVIAVLAVTVHREAPVAPHCLLELRYGRDHVLQLLPLQIGVGVGGGPLRFEHRLVVEAVGDGVGLQAVLPHLEEDLGGEHGLTVHAAQLQQHTVADLKHKTIRFITINLSQNNKSEGVHAK